MFFNPTADDLDIEVTVLTPDGEWVLDQRTLSGFEANLLPEQMFALRDDEVLRAAITGAVGAPLCNVFPAWLDVPSYAVGRERVAITAAGAIVVPSPAPGRIHRPFGFGEQVTLSWSAAGPGGALADFAFIGADGVARQFLRSVLAANEADFLYPGQPIVRHGETLVAEDALAGGYAFMAYAISQA